MRSDGKFYALLRATGTATACACAGNPSRDIIRAAQMPVSALAHVASSTKTTAYRAACSRAFLSSTSNPASMNTGSTLSTELISDDHYKVKHSAVHGNGVFAKRKIPAGARIIEYQGKRISDKQAEKRFGQDPDNPYHTFFFSLESGKLIDGGDEGNAARWINHSCEPNCEAQEEKGRVFIHALRDIRRGEELNYDYGLVIDEKLTKALKKAYACRCGHPSCRGTMLAVKKKSGSKKSAKKKVKK